MVITSEYGTSAITCIDTYDLTGEGNENLLIGRRDGSVQVFSLPAEDEVDLEPREIYREVINPQMTGWGQSAPKRVELFDFTILSFSSTFLLYLKKINFIQPPSSHIFSWKPEKKNQMVENVFI